ncbi:MAG: hypothetical protein ACR2MO_15440 [Acidimicrobiales bacterium]
MTQAVRSAGQLGSRAVEKAYVGVVTPAVRRTDLLGSRVLEEV